MGKAEYTDLIIKSNDKHEQNKQYCILFTKYITT